MATAAVQLPGRLRSPPFFLAVWVLSYLAPHLAVGVADPFVRLAMRGAWPAASDAGFLIVWLGLLPALFAWAQWLLMRRCVSTAIAWAVAMFVGTLLARLGLMLIDDLDLRQAFGSPVLSQVFVVLEMAFGTVFAATALAVLPLGACFGAATSIPQAVVLPASMSMRVVWIAVMIPTGYASTALGEGLYRVMRMAMFDLTGSFDSLLPRLVVVNFAPRLCAWLLTAVVSGLLMHAILRRRAGRMGDQLYAQFD